jgi:hypothetical protein
MMPHPAAKHSEDELHTTASTCSVPAGTSSRDQLDPPSEVPIISAGGEVLVKLYPAAIQSEDVTQYMPFSTKSGTLTGTLCSYQLVPASVVAITTPITWEKLLASLFPTAKQSDAVGQDILFRPLSPDGMV